MSHTNIRQIIIESLKEAVKTVNAPEADMILDGDKVLEIDSLVGVVFICILEEKLGVALPDDFLTPQNCRSVNKITGAYLKALSRRSSSGNS